jgi:hypothetical protein
MGVPLIHGVVGEDQGELSLPSYPHGCIPQKERVVTVDNVRSQIVDPLGKDEGNGQADGEVAPVEVLNGRNPDYPDIVRAMIVLSFLKMRGDNSDPVSQLGQVPGKHGDRAGYSSHMGKIGVGKHQDVHGVGVCFVLQSLYENAFFVSGYRNRNRNRFSCFVIRS